MTIVNSFPLVLGHVGVPLCCLKYKLVDVPEMNYTKESRTGEICIKGSSVFIGYYKQEEETYKLFTEDGWLKTGDIGRINEVRIKFRNWKSIELDDSSGFSPLPN